MRGWVLACFAAAVLASAAPAQAPAPTSTELSVAWLEAPEFDAAGVRESFAPAVNYWSQVEGLPTTEQACPEGIVTRIIETNLPASNGNPAAAWATKRDPSGAFPCTIWVEADWIAATEYDDPVFTARARCPKIVHEYGHLLGLDHHFRGDLLNLMDYIEDQSERVPTECIAAFPLPQLQTGIVDFTKPEARRAVRDKAPASKWKIRTVKTTSPTVENRFTEAVFTLKRRSKKSTRTYRVFAQHGFIHVWREDNWG